MSASSDTQVFTEYDPSSEVYVLPGDPLTNIPSMTPRAAELLFTNAYARTIAEVADIPKQFPGLASAFSQDPDFKTWNSILEFATRVVNTPGGIAVNRSAFVSVRNPDEGDTTAPANPVTPDPQASCRLM